MECLISESKIRLTTSDSIFLNYLENEKIWDCISCTCSRDGQLTSILIDFNNEPILSAIPPGIANLTNLEILNLANNHIEELPVSISSMPKLRILNLSINRLSALPRGFGAFPVLEVLDLSYNNLNEKALPGNFFMMGELNLTSKKLWNLLWKKCWILSETLRALYLGDNEFEHIPPELGNLKNLQIVSWFRNS